ncbi:MAG: UDP-galactopyranose mutase [Candidatus Promineifilaceae bacterium]|jgi:UDP-galactopyranose mutase
MEPDLKDLRYLIVGAGIFGCTIAECIARRKKERVLVIDKRDHIGGNCYSEANPETGIEVHKYGTHIFHTADEEIWQYINRFTEFNSYRHQVLTTHGEQVFQMPINLETINTFYKVNLRPYQVDDFLKKEIAKDAISDPQNFEEMAITMIGRPLYEAFIKGYTIKQWARDPKDLPASILKRLPFRKNYDESYYFDRWQGIPLKGYTAIFERMLDNPLIDVALDTDYFELRDRVPTNCLTLYTGALDRFFDYDLGRLEYRTLKFEEEVVNVSDYQGTSVMNYADPAIPFTRIHEPRHLHPERKYTEESTVIIREYPKLDTGDNPYYPVNTTENNQMVEQYIERTRDLKNIIFGGRLADYKYYDMDRAIAKALELYETKYDPHVPSA